MKMQDHTVLASQTSASVRNDGPPGRTSSPLLIGGNQMTFLKEPWSCGLQVRVYIVPAVEVPRVAPLHTDVSMGNQR